MSKKFNPNHPAFGVISVVAFFILAYMLFTNPQNNHRPKVQHKPVYSAEQQKFIEQHGERRFMANHFNSTSFLHAPMPMARSLAGEFGLRGERI